MPTALLHTTPLLLAIFAIFAVSFLIQMLYYWVVFFRVRYKAHARGGLEKQRNEGTGSSLDTAEDACHAGVSVVICAHNECHNLALVLPAILEQDYPVYEVIVVNHASEDDTDALLTDLSVQYAHLKVVNLPRDLNFFSGKKFPLALGIRSAKHPIVLLTDADCRPTGNQWITCMSGALKKGVSIVLGYGAYEKRRGVLNALIRFDALQVAVQYLSFAMAGQPYMGVGRNLLYRKSLFFDHKGFIGHYRIQSGDDDLFINRAATRKNTAVMADPESITWSKPKTSFRQWFFQKKRHLTTGSHYRFIHKMLLGLYSLSQLIFWITLIILLSLKFAWTLVLGVLFVKWVSQYVVFGSGMKRLQGSDLIPWIPLLEWILILVNLGAAGSNLMRKPVKWK